MTGSWWGGAGIFITVNKGQVWAMSSFLHP
ncbi:unnamed protein product [Nezara viridula]|uniref:Uncharacterized protein n=1 Tax=Nezara viridula TaxID=85310 RepID=A0A9P0H1W3_NEZVI|nr:unnamed protein product [Nezara viridula]